MNKDLKKDATKKALIHTARSISIVAILFVVCCLILFISLFWREQPVNAIAGVSKQEDNKSAQFTSNRKRILPAGAWIAPDESTIPADEYGNMIRYGKELVANTSKYFGPNGSIARISNGMNCQNCHLEAGTRPFANNYSVFFSSYPKTSARSGKVEEPSARIADCFQRSLAGKMPDESSKEIKAMLAYMKWLATGINKSDKVVGTKTEKLKYLDRPASPESGQVIYNTQCKSCHGDKGEGVMAEDKRSYIYPPLWGKHSYNDGAGMYRLSNFAGFVKNNMPFGASFENPQLTDEQAWDVAAYVNSQTRPHREQSHDYPDLSKKPLDAPFGPYADKYSQAQHKYGPFEPIVSSAKNQN